MASAFTQSLHATLEQTIAPDTAIIKAATVQLNAHFYKDPQCVPALFEIGSSSPNAAIRQLALVELRKRVQAKKNKQWTGQAQELRTQIKARVLELIVSETSSQARAAETRFVSALAQIELPNGTWPELLPWLQAVSASTVPAQREVALQALYMLLDTIVTTPASPGASVTGNVAAMLSLLQSSLSSESIGARVWTIRALGKLSEYIEVGEDREIAAFQSIIPAIVEVLSISLEATDEASAKSIFEVIEGLTLSETPLLTPHLAALVQFLLTASANQNYDNDLRIMSLNSLLWIVKFKKSKIQSLNLAGPIITGLLPIGAEPEPTEADEDVPARTAFRVIDTLATSLPPAQVFPPLFEQVRALSQSPDPLMRKSAITAFGVVVEGCSLFIQPHLESLWPLIQAGLSDPEVVVRKAACTALGCLCEMLDEDCAAQHAMLMPLIAKLIGDPETQRSACVALDCLLEVLGNEIEPYIPSLMESLLALLENAPLNLKGTVVGAIGSAAHASKVKFTPYFTAAMQRIVPFLALTEEGDELDLRGVAQDTVGTLAEAVGKEMFRPYYAPLMEAAFQAMAVPNAPQLKECSYIFFAVVARVYQEEFASYLPTVMPILLGAVQQNEIDESAFLGADDSAHFSTGADDDDDDFEDIDEDLDEDDEEAMFSASTAIAIEKECATDAISEIFAHVKAPFLPYVETTVGALLPGLQHHWHDGIRKSSVAALLSFISTFHEMSDQPKWKKGAGGAPLSPNVAQLAGAILPAIVEMWEDEEERDVVNELCNSFSAVLMSVGPALLTKDYLEPVCKHLNDLLNRTAKCQLDDEDDGELTAGLAEQSEYDQALISSACDLVGTLATTLGGDFAPLFNTFLPAMASGYAPDRNTGDRSTAIGSLAEITNGLETAVTPFSDTLYPLFMAALADPEHEVQSNGAFAIGSLVYNSQADLSGQYLAILSALHPLFEASTKDNARDNACGAVARMVLKNAPALPLEQVVPLLVQALPLRRDFAESEKVFDAILALFQAQNPAVLGAVDHLLAVFAHALGSLTLTGEVKYYPDADAQITSETKDKLVQLIKHINASEPARVQAAGLVQYL